MIVEIQNSDPAGDSNVLVVRVWWASKVLQSPKYLMVGISNKHKQPTNHLLVHTQLCQEIDKHC